MKRRALLRVCADPAYTARMASAQWRFAPAAIGMSALIVLAATVAAYPASAAPYSATEGRYESRSSTALNWIPCPGELTPTKQCATLAVPRDYRNPQRGSFSLAVARIPATGSSDQRIGSLFWDAGGPGGAGVSMMDSYANRMSPEIKSRFDFVSWDPRGIGQSVPALRNCETPWPAGRPARTATPNWTKILRTSARELKRANRKCQSSNRSLINDMGTNNVVRDLDRLRQAVGDPKLTYWAGSYGTRIGYVYALRHPEKVRAMLMDGSVDPDGGYAELPRGGGLAADIALQFMRRNYHEGYKAIVSTAASLTKRPVHLTDGDIFSRWDFLDLAGEATGAQAFWPSLIELQRTIQRARGDDAEAQQARASLANLRNRHNGNEGSAFSVVNCLDYASRPTPGQQIEVTKLNARRAPVFGGSITMSYAIGCRGLRLRPDPIPSLANLRNRLKVAEVPVLLANGTADGATPIFWARSMQRGFSDRPMIKYRSGQHEVWGAVASACVNDPIDRFMIRLRQPHSATCPFVRP